MNDTSRPWRHGLRLFAYGMLVVALVAAVFFFTSQPNGQSYGSPSLSPTQSAEAALRQLAPGVRPSAIEAAPIAGFQEAVIDGHTVYISDDGRYLIQGDLIDVYEYKNLSRQAVAKVRAKILDSIPVEERIIFAPDNPRFVATIFTDVGCGFCRKLHEQIQTYLDAGIAIQYLAYPRAGPGSEDFSTMHAVWCADDRQAALTAAKLGQPVAPAPADCQSPVGRHLMAGREAGLTGTPMILAADGTELGGYLTAPELLAMLEHQATQSAMAGRP